MDEEALAQQRRMRVMPNGGGDAALVKERLNVVESRRDDCWP